MIRVTNHGAACCVIEAEGTRILTDPWFTDGIYLGAWTRQDEIPDPLTVIGPCDYVWISHLHEDHFDPVFLRQYFTAYPSAKLWISAHCRHLIRLTAEFKPLIANSLSLGGWIAAIIPNRGYEADCNIDTALVVTDADSAVVNLNDNPKDEEQVAQINAMTVGKHVTALLPFTGAGPWPQCYALPDHEMYLAAEAKKKKFLKQFTAYREALHADVAVPFSAGYKLRGALSVLNSKRGIPELSEVPGATILPVVGARIKAEPTYEWESETWPENALLEKLIQQASERAPKMQGDPLTIELDWGAGSSYVDCTYGPAQKAHETLIIHPCLLLRLLDGRAHWNTYEISSHAKIIRHGAAYDHRVFDYLNRFQATRAKPTQEKNLAISKELVYVR